MELVPLDPRLRKRTGGPERRLRSGRASHRGRQSRELGIQSGDVIVSIDRKPVTTPEEAATQLKEAAAARGNTLLLLNRHGVSQFVGLSIENDGTAEGGR